mgnify:CR=1 FL=1
MANAFQKVLVTGGAGFIGSHVADEFLDAGYGVRILDNLEPPTHDGTLPEWVSRRAEFIQGDVRNKEDWRKALQGVDAVIHLAAHMDNHLDFSRYIRTNVESIAVLFEAIEEDHLPIKKIIAASSQSVYGEGKYHCDAHGTQYAAQRTEEQLSRNEWEQACPVCGRVMSPVPEIEEDILKPQIPYGISKLTSEQLLKNLGKRYNIPVVLLRFSIVLGPRQSFRHFYSGALRAFSVYALNNEPILITEDGKQTRDFVHVRDVASAHRLVLEDPRADFESFNVGSNQATPIIELAKMAALEAGAAFNPLDTVQYRQGDARHQHMDSSKLERLGWRRQHSLQDAVKEYVAWVKQFGDAKQFLDKTNEHLKAKGILKGGNAI